MSSEWLAKLKHQEILLVAGPLSEMDVLTRLAWYKEYIQYHGLRNESSMKPFGKYGLRGLISHVRPGSGLK